MTMIFGLPQELTGQETVTIQQVQNGQVAQCTMPLSDLSKIINLDVLVVGLPTSEPATPGVVWNNSGVISIS